MLFSLPGMTVLFFYQLNSAQGLFSLKPLSDYPLNSLGFFTPIYMDGCIWFIYVYSCITCSILWIFPFTLHTRHWETWNKVEEAPAFWSSQKFPWEKKSCPVHPHPPLFCWRGQTRMKGSKGREEGASFGTGSSSTEVCLDEGKMFRFKSNSKFWLSQGTVTGYLITELNNKAVTNY